MTFCVSHRNLEPIERFKNKVFGISKTRLNLGCSSPASRKHFSSKNAKQLRQNRNTVSGLSIVP